MNHSDATSAIRDRFNTLIEVPETLLTEYPNSPFASAPADVLWARLTIMEGDSIQVTIGNKKRYRYIGVMSIQIFTPAGKGTSLVEALAEKIKNNFRSVTAGNVVWRSPTVKSIGRQPSDSPWWQTNVVCPFYFDELETT